MKRTCFVIMFFLLIIVQAGFSQTIKPYPIPSYNIQVNGMAVFQESAVSENDSPLGRRKIHVQIICQKNLDTLSNMATVWIYSLDGLDILGPYYLACGNTLEVEIDDREWGALVESDMDINVSVWID
jgi:hypothetical protein